MDLEGEIPIKEAFQSTKSLQESISTAVTNRGSANPAIWNMLAAVKTISYNAARHEINLHFFTREEAQRFEGLEIPFHRQVHALNNAHSPALLKSGSSVWDRQLEADGELLAQEAAYVVILRNVARSMDMSRFHSFLKYALSVPFDLNDLDLGGPDSNTSTAWELSFSQEGCPDALLGIKRILWFNSVIVVQHPTMRGRQQCLRCGGLGHPMRLCNLSAAALKGNGSIVAAETTLAQLQVQPATFTSLAELQDAMAKCHLKRDEPKISERTPLAEPGPSGTSKPMCSNSDSTQEGCGKQEAEWFNGSSKNSRGSNKVERSTAAGTRAPYSNPAYPQANTPSYPPAPRTTMGRTKQPEAGSRYNPLVIDSSEDATQQDPDKKDAATDTHRMSTKAMQQVHAELLVAEDAAKAQLREALGSAPSTPYVLKTKGLAHRQRDDAPPVGDKKVVLSAALQDMGLKSVPTPKTGNCQVYSVAQALANESLEAQPSRLTQAATALKAGCVARALIDFSLKYPHGQRKQTLLRLGRGYEKMASPVSEAEFRKYLLEYGSSSSATDVFIPGNVWGSNDTLAAFGMMLQRDIIVISPIPGTTEWSALHYKPETRQAKQRDYSTCGEYPLSAVGCVRMVQELTRRADSADGPRPIVLHYAKAHYNAYIFGVSPGVDDDVDMVVSDTEDPTNEHSETVEAEAGWRETQAGQERLDKSRTERSTRSLGRENKTEEDALSDSVIGSCSSQSPWDPEEWDGDLDELKRRMKGPTIHHALKLEITQILRVGGERMNELLHFLVETVTQLSLPEQQRLLAADLNDPVKCTEFMTEFQIPEPVVRQWQYKLAQDHQSRRQATDSSALPLQLAQSDPDYYPSTSQSSADEVVKTPTRARRILQRPVKRTHVATPEDRRDEAGRVVNANNRAVPLKKRSSEDPTKNLLTLFEGEEDSARQPDSAPGQMPSWPLFWSANTSIWQERTKVSFPEADAEAEVWVEAARTEPDLLLHLIRTFGHPHEILQRLPPLVTTELTEHWRVECWRAAVVAAQQANDPDPARVSRLAEWYNRAESVDQHHLRKAIINSPDEWIREKGVDYGRDAAMRLCSPDRINRLGSYLLCAIVYSEKIAALTGQHCYPDDSPVILLHRHLDALRQIPQYKASFLARDHANTIQWEVFGQYMSSAVAVDDSGTPGHGEDHLLTNQY